MLRAAPALLSVAVLGSPALKGPPLAPKVLGPRLTTSLSETYTFVARSGSNRSTPARFRCAVNGLELGRCRSPFRATLRLGTNTLRVLAIDHAGRASVATTAM